MEAATTEKNLLGSHTQSATEPDETIFLKIFKFLSKDTWHSKPHSSDLLRTES